MSNLKKHPEDVARTLELLNRGSSQADVAEHHQHTPRTIRRWLKRIAVQSLRIHDHFFRNLTLGQIRDALLTLGLSGIRQSAPKLIDGQAHPPQSQSTQMAKEMLTSSGTMCNRVNQQPMTI